MVDMKDLRLESSAFSLCNEPDNVNNLNTIIFSILNTHDMYIHTNIIPE